MQVWQFNPSSAAALGLALASAGLTAGCTPDAPKQTQRGAAAAAASVGRTGASAPAAPRPSSGGAVTAAPNGPPPDEGSFVFEDFLAPVTPAALAASLSDWTAHVGTELRPVGITLFGDVLLIDRQNQIHVLDPSFGDVELVARSQEQFGARLQELAFQEALLRLRLARSVLGRAQPDASAGGALVDGDLQAGQVFGFRVPLILGGRPSAENVVRVSATTMLAMNALLLKQLDTAPFGEPVRVEFRNFPGLGAEGPNNARPSFVRTARDRPSLALQR